MGEKTVAMLTAGGLAPCLSSAVGGLIERYTEIAPDVRIVAYRNGYAGLLTGNWIEATEDVRANAGRLHAFGGSPIGNSRVKLTNVEDCVKRGLVEEGQDPLEVAAEQLKRDGIDILHTIGGDDTNTAAADLKAHLAKIGSDLTVVGLPKTIDNDVVPIRQSLGAWTAAEQGALYARNIIAEFSANPNMLIVHEVMGRHCGWLTAATARAHHEWVGTAPFAEWVDNAAARWDVHGVYIPERAFDLSQEVARLRGIMDEHGGVNLFISEGAGMGEIVAAMEAAGEEVPRDAFGHVKLDKINPGQWFADRFAKELGAEKVLVQKSGYFSRSAPANASDRELIEHCTRLAVDAALAGTSGVVGHDEERGDELRVIEFERIAGGKKFDVTQSWFRELLSELGQA
ncbi:pyrophosphate--fructose-6-phosphate 1-phosphotransferase [Qipengyuania sp. 1NDW9]|uniref:pyrophosphate--fructose-6-phosphate 1-phosphotransferase n=1 Tax=Qipengyuania TaxID=1855416 RepID=UPI001C8766A1|nr:MULTISPECIES: pyrophosphate--fructose-6-phosphate 1-phosphotransferase [Qipengyuania]MBX7493771.1 pyrophosphate--fructose-6-phosphate 1-phosphotransferase [Qipengyuania xiapuensis]UOR14209.1 pyrophosphate--fructose-6-phosphate 1-phosphotransferase [Qipengyuania aquimaris]